MRTRSHTIMDLDELEEAPSSAPVYFTIPLLVRQGSSNDQSAIQFKRRYSVVITKEWEREQELEKLKEIQKINSEIWHENETSIVIKMLDQSMKENDSNRTLELEKSLLELERNSELRSDEESPTNHLPSAELLPERVRSFTELPYLESYKEETKSEENPFSQTEAEYLKKAIMQNTRQYDDQITIMLIGDEGVGKTCMMNSWLGLVNPFKTKHTLGYIIIKI